MINATCLEIDTIIIGYQCKDLRFGVMKEKMRIICNNASN